MSSSQDIRDPAHQDAHQDPQTLRFALGERTVTAADLRAQARRLHPAKPKTASAPAAAHRGWRVLGHAPGALAEAEKTHRLRAQHVGTPAPFDPQHWRMSTRKTAIHVRPYALEQAALECAALARKAGWLDVVVEPLTKGAS